MRRAALLLAGTLAACSGGGGGDDPPPPPPVACVGGQCATGFHCDLAADLCVANGCTTTADCPTGSSCTGWTCVPGGGTATCTTHADCAPDRLCNTAIHACQATLSCSSLTPCPGGWECVAGGCQALPAGTCKRPVDCLALGDRCAAGRCVGCASTGEVCTGAAGTCDAATNSCATCATAADCPAGLLCTPDGCAECDDNADCARFAGRPYCIKPMYSTVNAGVCGECGGGAYGCDASSRCLTGDVCASWTSCYSEAGCGGAHPHCDLELNACVACTADAHCPSGQVCRTGLCHVTQPGDRCQDPYDLALGARTDVSVALPGFGCDSETGSCYPGGADAFYRFTLAAETRLELRLTASDGAASAALQLFSDGCGEAVKYRLVSSVQGWTTYLPPGAWVLRFAGDERVRYVLTVLATPVDPPAGNSCVEPIAIAQSPSGTSVTGSTDGLLPVSGDSCSEGVVTPAPTAIYALDLAQASYVELLATPLSSSFRLDLDVKDLCPAAPWHYCNQTPGAPVARTFRPLPAGLHYVIVDAEGGTSGSYRLDAVVNPWSPNDACADATALAFTAGVATETGSTHPHSAMPSASCSCALAPSCGNDLGPCQGTSAGYQACGNDVFYRLTTTADRRLDVSVTSDGTWTPAFTVRAACGAATGAACGLATGAVASATVNVLPPGTYLVQVASTSALAGGPFTLQVALSEPVYPVPANDRCEAATALAPPAAQAGDTRGAADDESGACGGQDPGAGGRDVAFRYTLPGSRGRLNLAVRPVAPTAATFQPVLRVRDGCPGAAQLACAMASAPGAAATLAPLFVAPGTTLHVSVDGAAGTSGTFSLEPSFTLAPSNDTCAGAAAMTLSSTVPEVTGSGSLAAAWQDGACAGVEGPDVFYAVQPPSGNHTVRLTVQPAGFTAGLAYYGADACGASCTGTPPAVAGGAPGQSVSLTVSTSAGRPAYLGVSSVDGARGTYTVTATLDPP